MVSEPLFNVALSQGEIAAAVAACALAQDIDRRAGDEPLPPGLTASDRDAIRTDLVTFCLKVLRAVTDGRAAAAEWASN